MCMSKGVPKKPEYGPCRESHGGGSISFGNTTYLYNGVGNGYYWSNPTTASTSVSPTGSTAAYTTAAGWTTI